MFFKLRGRSQNGECWGSESQGERDKGSLIQLELTRGPRVRGPVVKSTAAQGLLERKGHVTKAVDVDPNEGAVRIERNTSFRRLLEGDKEEHKMTPDAKPASNGACGRRLQLMRITRRGACVRSALGSLLVHAGDTCSTHPRLGTKAIANSE